MSHTPAPGTPTGRDAAFNDPAMSGLAGGPGAPMSLKQPSGLRVLFMTEMWERFSYYGMKALLTIYLVTVISIGSLQKGTYSNTLELSESQRVGEDDVDIVRAREYQIVVGGAEAKETASQKLLLRKKGAADTALPDTVKPGLVIQKLKKVADGKDDKGNDRFKWELDEADTGAAVTLSGQAGGAFSNEETRYRVSNPTDKPIKYKFQMRRDGESQTYFTVNDSPTAVNEELKPDKEREETAKKLGELYKPLEVVVKAHKDQSGLNWTKDRAGNLMAWYTGLVYLTPIIGGILADRFLGTHRSLLIGGTIIASGHFVLMAETIPTLYTGLCLVIIGTGFFKSNVSTMVGQLFHEGDKRRDAAFTIFYMGINLGAFIGPLLCGWLRVKYGWSWAFGAAGFGMVLGLIQYSLGRPKHLAGIGLPPASRSAGDLVRDKAPLTHEEKQRVAVIFIMAFFVIFFWTAFEQASGSMAYFGNERTNRALPEAIAFVGDRAEAGQPAMWPTEWLQSVNPLMILILAPIFAQIWVRLATKGKEPSTPAKFSIGMITLGLGFLFMVFGANAGSDGSKVSPFWIFAAFFLHTCGELCLSPVGLSMITKLAPLKIASALMGIWFLANFVANWLAAQLSGQVDKITESGFMGIPGYTGFFTIFVIFPCAAGAVLIFLTPAIKRMMHGKG